MVISWVAEIRFLFKCQWSLSSLPHPQPVRAARQGVDLIMNFWTPVSLVGGASNESVFYIFKNVFKYPVL